MFKKYYEEEIENRRLDDGQIYRKVFLDWYKSEKYKQQRECHWQDFQDKIKDRLE